MATIKGIKAGTTTITARYGSLSSTVNLTVAQLDVKNATIGALSNQTYTGSAFKLKPTVTMTVGGVSTTLVENTDYTLSWNSNSDGTTCIKVGTITVTVTGKGNYKGTNATRTYQITNASFTVTEPDQSYVYNGSAQGKAITVSDLKGGQTATIKYGTASGTYNLTSAPQITNVVDSKTIYWQVTAPNHNTQTGSYTLTITKATPGVPVLTKGTGNYNGSTTYYAKAANASKCATPSTLAQPAGKIYYGTSKGSTSYSITAGTAANLTSMGRKDVGTTTIYAFFRPTDTDNYNDSAQTESTTVVVSNGTLTVTATPYSAVYDGAAHAGITSISAKNQSDAVVKPTYTYSTSESGTYNSTIPTVQNVTSGTRIYWKATLSGYNDASGSVVAKVTNATFTVSEPDQTYIYNTKPQGKAITVSDLKGGQTATIKYGTTSGTYDLPSAPQITNVAESKTIYWQVTAPNHTSQTGSYALTITKATPTFALHGDTKVFHDTAYIKATASVAGTVHWGTSTSSMNSTTPVSAGTATNVTSRGNSDGVGTTTIYAYFTPTDASNYNSVGSSSSYAQSAAAKITASTDNNISVSISSNLAYNGASQVIATKTGGEGCASFTLGYSTESNGTVTWGTENATKLSVTGPGTYYIHYKVTPDSNHSTTITDKQLDGTAVIGQGTLTITITGYSGTYDGNSHNIVASGPTVKNQEDKAVTGVTYTYSTSESGTYSSSLTRINATGTASNENATVTYWVKAAKSGYTTAKKSFTVYIARAVNPLTISPTSKTIYNTSGYNTFIITPSGAQGDVSYSSSATGKATVDSTGKVTYAAAGNATITVTAAGNANYKSGSKTCAVTTKVDKVSSYGNVTGTIVITQEENFPAGGVTLTTSNISTYFSYSTPCAQTITWESGNTTKGKISYAWSGDTVSIPSLGTTETSGTTNRTFNKQFTVTATGEGSKTASKSVTSGKQEANPVMSIVLKVGGSAGTKTINFGDSATTEVTATYKSGATGVITPTSITSSNTDVATVS